MNEKLANNLLPGTTVKQINGEMYWKIPFTLIKTNKQLSSEGGWTMILNDMIRIIKDTYDFKIYVYLCSLWNRDSYKAFPSIEQIANECSISDKRVRNSINSLKELGAIKVSRNREKATSQWIHNSYEIFYFSQNEDLKYFSNKKSLIEKLTQAGLAPICNKDGFIIDVVEIEPPYNYTDIDFNSETDEDEEF